ncbi:basic helix-loop-helix DNA-binding superfamily protein [Perilla frutescens var. hirtella]|uniref:Basic helix-loop-helix DNA-binding superfamily protein n=1 Tax=Perilla frutescens var. hirtella TaxID=608512 RepID=A0AAD4P0P4_PERFH|nr:basic helix-loop-helix DNA-binding superfamily protein [Perilla frutescens var. hirtella]KAH6822623.1 basic helix-loop-helix DNA-binding superfamily protein [Perilla frutescens var. hirtella]
MQQQNSGDGYMGMGLGGDGGGGSTLTFPDVSQILPWTLPPVHFSPRDHDPFLLAAAGPPSYGALFNRRQFGYDGSSATFGLQAELQKLSAQEIMDAKALAASKSHSEAERRRRERINNHFAKLRSLLPSTTKTDKASLLAEVIQHVNELKRQTSVIAETSPVPTEMDELTVDNASDEDGKWVIKASICCEDRSDLLPELIKTLKALKLKTLRAEITTIGGRVRNVLFITGDEETNGFNGDDDVGDDHYSITSIREALKSVMDKSNGEDSASGSVKRQRTTNANNNILDHYRSL